MPIFTDVKAQRGAVVFLFFLVAVIVYLVTCKKANLTVGEVSMSPHEISQTQQSLLEVSNEFKKQVKTVTTIPLDGLSKTTKDTLTKIVYQRQMDINESEELLGYFDKYDNMSAEEKVSLVQKTLLFLNKTANPNRFRDYGEIAKKIVAASKLEYLSSENQLKDLQIAGLKQVLAELQGKMAALGSDNVRLKADLNKINNLYATARGLLEVNKARLEKLLTDSSKYATDIDTLKLQNSYLSDLTSKMKATLSSFNPVRISYCAFRSPGCRSKRDGSYILSCMRQLELKFILNYNDPKSENRDEAVLVVFTFPQLEATERQIRKTTIAKIGQITKVIIDEKDGYKFTTGFYSAQIIHEQFSKTKPLEMQSLTVKRFF